MSSQLNEVTDEGVFLRKLKLEFIGYYRYEQ